MFTTTSRAAGTDGGGFDNRDERMVDTDTQSQSGSGPARHNMAHSRN
jgi:hypothetical protein